MELPITKKEILDSNFALYLQIQFNFLYYALDGYYKFLELGALKLIRKAKSVILTVGNSDSVEVPLYDPYNTWNHIFMVHWKSSNSYYT